MARFEEGKIYEFIAHIHKLAAVPRGRHALLWKFNNYTVESKVGTAKMDEGELAIVWNETLTMKIYFDSQMKDLTSKIQIFTVDDEGNRRKKVGKVEFDLSKYLLKRKPERVYLPVKRAKGKTLVFTIQSILPGQREKQVQKMIQLEEEALAREETKLQEEYNIVEVEQREFAKQLERMQMLIDRADKQATFRRQSKITQSEIESLKKLISEVPSSSTFNDEIQVKLGEKAALLERNHKLHIELLEVDEKITNVKKAIRMKLHPSAPVDPTSQLKKERLVARAKVEQLHSVVGGQTREVEDLKRRLSVLVGSNAKRNAGFQSTRADLEELQEKLDELNHTAEKQTEDLHLARRRINVKGHHRRHKEFYRTKTITNTRRRLRNAVSTQSELQAENELLLTRLVCMQSELRLQQERERRMLATEDQRREDEAAERGSRRSSMASLSEGFASPTSAKERLSNLKTSEEAAGPRVPRTPRSEILGTHVERTTLSPAKPKLTVPITSQTVAMRALERGGTSRGRNVSKLSTTTAPDVDTPRSVVETEDSVADDLIHRMSCESSQDPTQVVKNIEEATAGESFLSPLAPLDFLTDRVNTLEPDNDSNASDVDSDGHPMTYSSTPSRERSPSHSASRGGHGRNVSAHSLFTVALTKQMPDISSSPRERELRKRYLSPIGTFTPQSRSQESFDFEEEDDNSSLVAREAPVSVRRTAGAVCAFLEVNDVVADAESGVVKRFEKTEKLEKMLKSGRSLSNLTATGSDNELSVSRRSARSVSRTVTSAFGDEPSVTFTVSRMGSVERKGTDNYLSLTGGPDGEGEMRGAHMLLDQNDEVQMKYATKIRHLKTDLKLTQGYIESERRTKVEITQSIVTSRKELGDLHVQAELLRQSNAKLQSQVENVEAVRPDRLSRLTERRITRAERDTESQKEKIRELLARIESLRSEEIALKSQASTNSLLPDVKVIDPELIPQDRGILHYLSPDEDDELLDDDDESVLASLRSQERANVHHAEDSNVQKSFRETQASISDLLRSLPVVQVA